MIELWLTRLALLWLDGSISLLAALVAVGPYALALTGAGLLGGRPRGRPGRSSRSTVTPSRFTLR